MVNRSGMSIAKSGVNGRKNISGRPLSNPELLADSELDFVKAPDRKQFEGSSGEGIYGLHAYN